MSNRLMVRGEMDGGDGGQDYKQDDKPGDSNSLTLDVDTEPFDLTALRLSSLASPAFTTDGHEALMTGDLSLTKDSNFGEESKDDFERCMLRLEEEGKQESAESCHGDERFVGSCDKRTGNADPGIEIFDETDRKLHSESPLREHSRKERKRESEALSVLLPLQYHCTNTNELVEPSTRQSEEHSDDDMTVECASPRDPVELDEVPGPPHKKYLDERPMTLCLSPKIAAVHPLPTLNNAAASVAAYSLNTLFPVVYDPPGVPPTNIMTSSPTRHESKLGKEAHDNHDCKRSLKKYVSASTAQSNPAIHSKRDVQAVLSLRKQVESLRQQLDSVTKSLSFQFQVADGERKQLAQRNARLKAQMVTLTSDLVRTKAENTKLKTENELYAAKMPKLQAELSAETIQVDEKHAQTIQSQLEVTQLRAKLQVLQTRTENLDCQAETLQAELRAARRELRRRGIQQQQSDNKMKRLEMELHEAKVAHAQEMQTGKQKVAVTIQRLDRERIKRETELKKLFTGQLEDVRATLANTTKRRKELEQANATSEVDVAALRRRVEDQDEEIRNFQQHVRSLGSRLDRAEKTEVALRSQVSGLKIQIQAVEKEKKTVLRNMNSTPKASRPRPRSPPSPKVSDSIAGSPLASQTNDPHPLLCSCCEAILHSLEKADQMDAEVEPSDFVPVPQSNQVACLRCPALEVELKSVHDELLSVRTLHANELKVQATALERVLTLKCA